MKLVKYNQDIFNTLSLIDLASKDKETEKVLVQKNKAGEIWQYKELSTKHYLLKHLKPKLAERTVQQRIKFLDESGLIELDMTRSYRVSQPKLKTWKWVYKLSENGKAWLKFNRALYSK